MKYQFTLLKNPISIQKQIDEWVNSTYPEMVNNWGFVYSMDLSWTYEFREATIEFIVDFKLNFPEINITGVEIEVSY